MAGLYTLSKNERLTSKKLIDKIFKREGELISKFPVSFIFLEHPVMEPVRAQVLFSVPAKKVKQAHDRNRIKRQMKEIYRLNKPLLYEAIATVKDRQYICCLMFNQKVGLEFEDLESKVKFVLNEFVKKIS